MSGLGELLEVGDPGGPLLFNAGRCIFAPGSYIFSISNTTEVPLALCTATGSGFIQGVLYKRVAGAGGWEWKPVFEKHYHDADDDASGGLLFDAWIRNNSKLFSKDYGNPSEFHHALNGTASSIAANVQTGYTSTDIKSGTDLNANATAYDSRERVNFNSPVLFQWNGRIAESTSLLARLGVAMEFLSAGEDAEVKIGMEACSSAGAVWQVTSANGTSRNAEDTTDSFNPAGFTGYQLFYTPSTNLVYESSSGAVKSKTTNIPTSGTPDYNRLVRAGIKSMTSNAARTLRVLRLRLACRAVGSNWISYP